MPEYKLVNPKCQNVGGIGSEGYFNDTVKAKTAGKAATKLFERMSEYINNENEALMLFSIQKVDADGALIGNPSHHKGVKAVVQGGGGIGFFSDTEEQFGGMKTTKVKVTKYKMPKSLNMKKGGASFMQGGGGTFSTTFGSDEFASDTFGGSSMSASENQFMSTSLGGDGDSDSDRNHKNNSHSRHNGHKKHRKKKHRDDSQLTVHWPFWYYDTLWYNWPWYTNYIYDYNLYYTNLFRALTPISAFSDNPFYPSSEYPNELNSFGGRR